MTRKIDGALALVYAQWAQKKLAEGEMADQASKLEKVNEKQENVRKFRHKLNKALENGSLAVIELVRLKAEAKDLGIEAEVGGALDTLFRLTDAGQLKNGDDFTYANAEAFSEANYDLTAPSRNNGEPQLAEGAPHGDAGTYVFVDQNTESLQGANDQVKRIREALTDRLDSLKSEAAGQELDLQMASQEYSRASQLASTLLNTRNESLKSIIQALSRA